MCLREVVLGDRCVTVSVAFGHRDERDRGCGLPILRPSRYLVTFPYFQIGGAGEGKADLEALGLSIRRLGGCSLSCVVNNVLGEIVAGIRARKCCQSCDSEEHGFHGRVLRSLVRMPMRGDRRYIYYKVSAM